MVRFPDTLKSWAASAAREGVFIVLAGLIGIVGATVFDVYFTKSTGDGYGNGSVDENDHSQEDATRREVQRRLLNRPLHAIGEVLELRGAPVTEAELSIVLLTSPSCVYCRQSAPFHARLMREMSKRGLAMYVAVPDITSSKEWASRAGFPDESLYEWESLSHRGRVTPTLVVLDAGRVVRSVWAGTLNEEQEAELLRTVDDPDALSGPIRYRRVSEKELDASSVEQLQRQQPVLVLNVLDRPHVMASTSSGATDINIPLQELSARALVELDPRHTHVVECTYLTVHECQSALDLLRAAGHTAFAFNR